MTDARYRHPDAIVTGDWLEANLDDPNLRIFECTMYLQYHTTGAKLVTARNARPEYEAGHIPGAGYFDLQGDLSDNDSAFRFTMPAAEELARRLGARGVGDGHRVVLYSRDTLQWSTRVWWMLRAIGLDNAAVLDGGWHTWEAEGRPQSTDEPAHAPATLTAKPRPELFVGKDEVQGAIGAAGICTINALTPDLHAGADPRYGRAGRIPQSVNVPAKLLQDSKSLKITSPGAAQAAFAGAGADPDKKIIVYCGGGIAASLDAFLLHQLGYTDIAIYDNSMTEWANDHSLPMEADV